MSEELRSIVKLELEPITVLVLMKEPILVVKRQVKVELLVAMLEVEAELFEQLKQELVEHTRLIGVAGVVPELLMAKHIELAMESLLEQQLAGSELRLELMVKLVLKD